MGEEKHHPPEYWNVPTAPAPWEAFAGYSVYRQQQQNSHGCISAVRPKETWPEVVGLTVEEAAKIVKEDKPGAQIEIIQPPCYAVQQDLQPGRVRFFVDFSGKVHLPPTVG